AEATCPDFFPQLRDCAAAVVAAAGGDGEVPDLYFVGRSPESIFDYLRGIGHGTELGRRVHLLNVSLRCMRGMPRGEFIVAERRFRAYFSRLNLDPRSIAAPQHRDRPIVFADLVYCGQTFDTLLRLLSAWT